MKSRAMHQSVRRRHEELSPWNCSSAGFMLNVHSCPWVVNYSEQVHDATRTQSLSSAAQWSGKTNQARKTKGEHLSAKQWQDFEVISHASSERPTLMLWRTPLKQWRTPMEIIVKRVPEHTGCPTGSAAMNSCLFLLWKHLLTVLETHIWCFFFFSLSFWWIFMQPDI